MVKDGPAFQPHKRKASHFREPSMRFTELVIPAFCSKRLMFESVFNRKVRL